MNIYILPNLRAGSSLGLLNKVSWTSGHLYLFTENRKHSLEEQGLGCGLSCGELAHGN